jgi:hypothetical protein
VARAATGGDQDMIGGDRLAVDFDRFGINKARKTSDHIDVVFAQYVVIRGMDTVDIAVRLAISLSQSKLLMVVSKP